MGSESSISFHYLVSPFKFSSRKKLKRFLIHLAEEEGGIIATMKIIFCTDDYLLTINQGFLHHHTLTDIITFPYSAEGAPIVSDIYISVERVRENALQFNQPFFRELHRVIFHGLLHLCGHKDKTTSQTESMRAKEEHYLQLYFVPRETFNEAGNVPRGTEG